MSLFIVAYENETSWYKKVILMELYHLTKLVTEEGWTINKTAEAFHCSMGLASENLRLAKSFHDKSEIIECETRAEALKKLNGAKYDY